MTDIITLSIVVPTRNRAHLLGRAVQSALVQTAQGVEVIVVDDASAEPVQLDAGTAVRVIRLEENVGISAARNAGVRAARGQWVGFVDDDDELLPRFAEVSLAAARQNELSQPVAVLSGLDNVTAAGEVRRRDLPPTLPRGRHFWLEGVPADRSFLTKQTLVVERDVLLGIGGFDETLRTREWTELFLRLNEVCSIKGIDEVTYRRHVHEGPRLSTLGDRRQPDFEAIVRKHRALLDAHPRGFARFLYEHAYTSYQRGQRGSALTAFGRALRVHPPYTLRRAAGQSVRILRNLFPHRPSTRAQATA